MNPEKTSPELSVSIENGDSRKLISLLALAAGAAAMPQSSHADIFYTDHTLSPITVGQTGTANYTINDLPGNAQILIHFKQHGTSTLTSYRSVVLRQYAGSVNFKATLANVIPVPAGMRWSQISSGLPRTSATAGVAYASFHAPNSFTDKYYAFRFVDSTAGPGFRYGWIHVSLFNNDLTISEGPHLTIFGWAYDSTGAQIAMGDVPEPSSAALLALGALMLGSKGLRSWRRNRVIAEKS